MEPDFGTLPLAIQWLLILAAVIVALWTIYTKAIRPMAKAGRTIHGIYEMVREDHERIAKVETRAEQLVNNGGSSMRDAIDRIEFKQAGQAKMLSDHVEWGQGELLKVWQNLASRDAVEAAKKTAEMLERKEGE